VALQSSSPFLPDVIPVTLFRINIITLNLSFACVPQLKKRVVIFYTYSYLNNDFYLIKVIPVAAEEGTILER
jgi:hypothetical protein